MTDEELATAMTNVKNSIKTRINDPDPAKALKAVQILISAMINNAGSLENLTALDSVLTQVLGG